MKRRIFSLLVLLCFTIENCFGAVLTIKERDITYDFTKTSGSRVTLEKTDPEIEGWNVKSGGVTLDENDSFIMPENDVEIEALYTEPTSYLLTLNIFGETTRELKNIDEDVTVSAVSNDNFLFVGWNATGISLTESEKSSSEITFKMPNNKVTLTTEYKYKYGITYNANGGTGAPEKQIKVQGEDIVLSSTIPTRTGYSFLGWTTDSSSLVAEYQPGDNFTEDKTTELYAVWNLEGYLLTVEYPDSTQTDTKAYGSIVTLTPKTITGKSFKNWSAEGISLTPEQSLGYTLTFEMPQNAVTITANYTGTYLITYDANGGADAPGSQTKLEGESITLTEAKPVRRGYKFLGWATANDATIVEYAPGDSFDTDENTTLYAVWERVIIITYDANGGTGAPDEQIKDLGVPITLSTTVPTKNGCNFLGWSKDSAATTATYQPGESFTLDEDTTLYAVWEIVQYELRIDYPTFTKVETQVPGDSVTVYAKDVDGYIFTGWTANGVTLSVEQEASLEIIFTMPQNAVELVANYKAIYEIIYDANGGSGAPNSEEIVSGETIALSGIVPTREGYTFLGWSRNNIAEEAEYQPGESFTVTENITLYAVWSANSYTLTVNPGGQVYGGNYNETKEVTAPVEGYTVTYNYNGSGQSNTTETVNRVFTSWTLTGGGSISDTAANPTVYTYGTSNGVLEATYTNGSTTLPGEAEREGYTFLGWSRNNIAEEAEYQPGESFTVTENITLYAVWSANSYTLTVNPGDQVYEGNYNETKEVTAPVEGYTVTYNYNGSEQSNTTEIVNRVFTSWTLTGGGSISNPTANPTVYTYGITSGTLEANYTNGSVTLPGAEEREGYTFLGWSTDSNATDATYLAGGAFEAGNDVTLYAVWSEEALSVYELTIDYPTFTKIEEHTEGSTVTVTTEPADGYTFTGWIAEGITLSAEQEVSMEITFTMPGNAVTLTANYEETEIQISSIPVGAYIAYNPVYTKNGSQVTTATVLGTDAGTLDTDNVTGIDQTFNFTEYTGGWKVMYNDGNQLTLIAAESVGTLTLGIDTDYLDSETDPKLNGGKIGYAKAIYTLNKLCNDYAKGEYAVSGRCPGYSNGPDNLLEEGIDLDDITHTNIRALIDDTSNPLTDPYYPYGDNYNSTEVDLIINTKDDEGNYILRDSGDVVWLASRLVYINSSGSLFGVRNLYSTGGVDGLCLYCRDGGGTSSGDAGQYGVRPIITLESGVQIVGGDGLTPETAYELAWETAPTYTISYNANGGSGAPSSQTKSSGTAITLSSTVPTRSGYNFLGWSTNSAATSAEYSAGGSFAQNANTTLYAVWGSAAYTITYNLDGGSNSANNPSSYTSLDSDIVLEAATKSGYNFKGWYDESDNLVERITSGSSGNIVLTARFAKLETVKVYNLFDSTDISDAALVWEGTVENQSQFDISTLGLSTTLDGYNFLGYYKDGLQYQHNFPITVVGYTNIYAMWKADVPWNEPVLGTGLTPVNWNGTAWEATDEENWDYNYELASTWSNSVGSSMYGVEGDGTAKWANAQTADGSLYVWIPRFTYYTVTGDSVSWNADTSGTARTYILFSNGTEDYTTDPTGATAYTYNKHSAFTLTDASSNTTELTGFWVGKYEASKGTGNVPTSKPGAATWESITISNMYAYAKDLNGTNTVIGAHMLKDTEWGAVAYLSSAIGRIPYINNKDSYAGYAGATQNATSSDTSYLWNTENGVRGSTTHNVYGVYDMSGGVTEYVAAYYSGGSTSYYSNLTTSYNNYGTKYVDYYTVSSPYGDNAKLGWDSDLKQSTLGNNAPVVNRGCYNTYGSAAGIFYFSTFSGSGNSGYGFRIALFGGYTVNYDANSGTGAPASQSASVGNSITLSSTVPTRSGYNFLGWSTDSTATSAEYSAGGSFAQNANTTLYAIWESQLPTLASVANVGDYVTYTPSSTSYTVSTSASGYTSNQTFNPSATTSWRVFSIDGDVVKLVSADSVQTSSSADLYLGFASGYTNAVKTLNDLCGAYVNSTYATSGRSIGSTDPWSETEVDSTKSLGVINTSAYPLTWSHTYTNGNNGFPYIDELYNSDVTILKNNSMLHTDGYTWLASREFAADRYAAEFYVRTLDASGTVSCNSMYCSESDGYINTNAGWYGVRPVITLKSGIKKASGSGTEASPYIISQ